MTMIVSTIRSPRFRKLFKWLSIAVISALALSWQGCRTSRRQTTTLDLATRMHQTVDSMLSRRLRLTVRERALVSIGQPSLADVSAASIGQPYLVAATTLSDTIRPTDRIPPVMVEYEASVELTDTTIVISQATRTDTLSLREQRKERKGRPPAASWPIAATALAAVLFAGILALYKAATRMRQRHQ